MSSRGRSATACVGLARHERRVARHVVSCAQWLAAVLVARLEAKDVQVSASEAD